jgi:endonuclease YncB( thermonuclease family)
MTDRESALADLRDHGSATPAFSLCGTATWARVVQIYDGDTMTCVLPVLGAHYKFAVRMAGIDACEMRSSNAAAKARAVLARDRVFERITGCNPMGKNKKEMAEVLENDVHLVWLECQGWDKYGRLMGCACISPGHESLAEMLMREKLAYAYSGGSKATEAEQILKLA